MITLTPFHSSTPSIRSQYQRPAFGSRQRRLLYSYFRLADHPDLTINSVLPRSRFGAKFGSTDPQSLVSFSLMFGQRAREGLVAGTSHADMGSSSRCGINSLGISAARPDSLLREAQSSSDWYWSRLEMFPSHTVFCCVTIATTFGTSQGPRHPLILNWTRFSNPRLLHSCFSHSVGTSGRPRSTCPQQQPWHTSTWAMTFRFVLSIDSPFCSPNRLGRQVSQILALSIYWRPVWHIPFETKTNC